MNCIIENKLMGDIGFWTVRNSNPFRSVIVLSPITPHLSSAIFLLFVLSEWVKNALLVLHPFCWRVPWIEKKSQIDLPQLQSVILGEASFICCQSVVFESSRLGEWLFRLTLITVYQTWEVYAIGRWQWKARNYQNQAFQLQEHVDDEEWNQMRWWMDRPPLFGQD